MSSTPSTLWRGRATDAAIHPGVVATGWLMAAWCVGFAVVNVVLESTGHLAESEYADHADAFAVMNWLVVGLKLLGAGIAVLSVRRPARVPGRVLGVAVWGAFATVSVYALGSVVQAIGLVAGLGGSAQEIDALDVGYLLFFLAAAAGWAVLAISYSRRHALGRGPAALGVLGAPVVLGFLLVAMPALLTYLGLMPAS